ncbi:helix-turn-helix transcriptional regulator [Amycolatopsis sp. NPDC051128]|uniref:helix-turn-helix domain-containing protein n=1 Tax=Amycolatopsis sp. NPDC051128 TaxID=3155412 RepID=UPI003436F09B
MAVAARSSKLSDLLEDLKARSGVSYEGIGRKIHASKSSAHRYCTGVLVPREFGVIERIGRACGASHAELLRLHDLWASAIASEQDVPAAATVLVEAPRAATGRPALPWKRRGSVVAVCLLVALAPAATPQVADRPVSGHSGPAR